MYKLKNGILHKNGKPVFGIGASYYPSFHEAKFPVPPDGDRIGEMKKDIKMMREIGFNYLRTAALGEVSVRDDDQIEVKTDFIDKMIEEAYKNEIATCVRLQGYILNLRNNTDYYMINEKNQDISMHWTCFIRNCLHHKGILRDNKDGTEALARHFSNMPGLVAYQIYNEPHYPYNGIFDYNPAAIDEYREWLVKKGIMDREAARSYEPPRRRPYLYENVEEWINWRLFSMESLSKFLADTASYAKNVNPESEVLTCITASPISSNNALMGASFFDSAEGMDCVGITHYIHFEGRDYFSACYDLDMAESAAALYGKHAWLIEFDARTRMPARKFQQETYAAIGIGYKGIVYYAWRGDYPYEGTPNPDNCGMIHYDGTKTEHFDSDVKMISLVNKYSDYIVNAEKLRSGVAILHSEYAIAHFDAYKTNKLHNVNPYIYYTCDLYKDLRNIGITVDIIRAEDLHDNVLGVKVLFLPSKEMLSKKEIDIINEFCSKGGAVYYQVTSATFGAICNGYCNLNKNLGDFDATLDVADVIELNNIQPHAMVLNNRKLYTHTLKGDGYYVVTIVNADSFRNTAKAAKLKLNFPAKKVTFASIDTEAVLKVNDCMVELPDIEAGALLIVE